jgi:hypothetical protein
LYCFSPGFSLSLSQCSRKQLLLLNFASSSFFVLFHRTSLHTSFADSLLISCSLKVFPISHQKNEAETE